jgi:putative phosphonate metabolism protein
MPPPAGVEGRVALYYAPLPADPLTHLSAAWLGRDPVTNAPVPQPDLNGIAEFTAEPRVYGFHATLKPPMRLIQGTDWHSFMAAVRAMAADLAPFDLPPLAIADIFGFLALRETEPCPPLQALADACVERVDNFRAPPSAEELARRRRATLSAEQDALLVRWGYPYVFDAWFFHMTLTRRLSAEEKAIVLPAAHAWFAPALAVPRRVEDICLFTQAAPGAAFTLAERIRLRG